MPKKQLDRLEDQSWYCPEICYRTANRIASRERKKPGSIFMCSVATMNGRSPIGKADGYIDEDSNLVIYQFFWALVIGEDGPLEERFRLSLEEKDAHYQRALRGLVKPKNSLMFAWNAGTAILRPHQVASLTNNVA